MKSFSRRCPLLDAFTLIELFVVIAVIGILVSVLLPSLSRARIAGESAACKSNLRQIGIGLRLYSGDQEVFPLLGVPNGGTFERYWFEDLESDTAKWPETLTVNGVYVCPGYSRVGGRSTRSPYPHGSYAYNVSGNANPEASYFSGLGLGGRALKRPHRNLEDVVPIRESEVRNPSDMIAIGDALLYAPSSSEYQAKILGGSEFLYPMIHPSLWLDIPVPFAKRNPLVTARYARERDATLKRHNRRFNVSFVDGHVESLSIPDLFGWRDSSLRRWNNDNEPHFNNIPRDLRN